MKIRHLAIFFGVLSTLQTAFAESTPRITKVLSDSPEKEVWSIEKPQAFTLKMGELAVLIGSGFGSDPRNKFGPDVSKLVVGTSRALERDLLFAPGTFSILDFAIRKNPYSESDQSQLITDPITGRTEIWPQTWHSDIESWTDTRIVFRVPFAATQGPIIVQTQKKTGYVASQLDPSRDNLIRDTLTMRLKDSDQRFAANHKVATLGEPRQSNAVPVAIINPGFAEAAKKGEAAFWSFDYNMGIFHHLAKFNWDSLLARRMYHDETGGVTLDSRDRSGRARKRVDPVTLFGAIPIRKGEVPSVVSDSVHHFDPFPMLMPLKSPLASPLISGDVWRTDFVGYVRAESRVTHHSEAWVGFSCAACHSRRITYQPAPGTAEISRVFPGIPNIKWSVKFTLAGKTGDLTHDKTRLFNAVPEGTAEMSINQSAHSGSFYHDDGVFAPTAIAIITRHTPVRRALSQTELVAGFEGSYIHGEEPDGASGPMHAQSQKELTAYSTTLDQNDELLGRIGMYQWLKHKNRLSEIDGASEGELIQKGFAAYPKLMSEIEAGKRIFNTKCLKCHQDNFGTHTNENMYAFKDVGTYFGPTTFQQWTGAIRTAMIRNLYWVQGRGLLHDGHVRSSDADHEDSIELLVDPDRCDERSAVYRAMYTMHGDHAAIPGKPYTLAGPSFRIPKGTWKQERATRTQAHFKDLPGRADDYLYYDYQEIRRDFGIREYGSKVATPFVHAAPHSYCVDNAEEIEPLVHYLMTP